jgi:hypothetical protein
MSSLGDILVHSLSVSKMLLGRYVGDLTAAEMLHRIVPQANCAAWIVGHLIVSERGALRDLGAALPALPAGFEERFSREHDAPKAADFGDVGALLGLFNLHRDALISAVQRAAPADLERPLEKPHRLFANLGQRVGFMAQHATMHAGQITMIRRHLGKPPLV